ncbi:hypothetical protein AYI70_g9457 [Smittium culicis]|uniref:Uncharacterized protein n=1 Tax=Smittium culicis TaxID=133412 RepID=A0A1R1XB51_9FUNG|nr:hypothetical protein AYI70_g9457 [Smittium culicis]
MVSIKTIIQEDRDKAWNTLCRSVCIETELQGGKILQLVSRPKSSGGQRTNVYVFAMEKPILLPPMEHDLPRNTKGKKRKSHTDDDYPTLRISDLVPNNIGDVYNALAENKSNINHSRPPQLKIITIQEQKLMLGSLLNIRRSLQKEGLKETFIKLLTYNSRAVKRRSMYYSIQKGITNWLGDNNNYTKISAIDIIKYLSELYLVKKL